MHIFICGLATPTPRHSWKPKPALDFDSVEIEASTTTTCRRVGALGENVRRSVGGVQEQASPSGAAAEISLLHLVYAAHLFALPLQFAAAAALPWSIVLPARPHLIYRGARRRRVLIQFSQAIH